MLTGPVGTELRCGWLLDDDSGGNGTIMYSYDGISWSESVGGTSFSTVGEGVAYGASSNGTPMWVAAYGTSSNGNSPMWVAVGDDNTNDSGHIKYSYDGISWSDSVGGTSFNREWKRNCLREPAGTELRCGWLLAMMTVMVMETSCTVTME